MIMPRRAVAVLRVVALSLVLAWSMPASAETVRYAGTVRAFDGSSLVLEDVGPGQEGRHEAPITPRTIAVTPDTALFVTIRAEDARSGFPGDYRETRADISELKVGAFVSVQCQLEGPRCRALKLTIVRTARS
jgi:hypothetical protein